MENDTFHCRALSVREVTPASLPLFPFRKKINFILVFVCVLCLFSIFSSSFSLEESPNESDTLIQGVDEDDRRNSNTGNVLHSLSTSSSERYRTLEKFSSSCILSKCRKLTSLEKRSSTSEASVSTHRNGLSRIHDGLAGTKLLKSPRILTPKISVVKDSSSAALLETGRFPISTSSSSFDGFGNTRKQGSIIRGNFRDWKNPLFRDDPDVFSIKTLAEYEKSIYFNVKNRKNHYFVYLFYANWCPSCHNFARVFKEIAKELRDPKAINYLDLPVTCKNDSASRTEKEIEERNEMGGEVDETVLPTSVESLTKLLESSYGGIFYSIDCASSEEMSSYCRKYYFDGFPTMVLRYSPDVEVNSLASDPLSSVIISSSAALANIKENNTGRIQLVDDYKIFTRFFGNAKSSDDECLHCNEYIFNDLTENYSQMDKSLKAQILPLVGLVGVVSYLEPVIYLTKSGAYIDRQKNKEWSTNDLKKANSSPRWDTSGERTNPDVKAHDVSVFLLHFLNDWVIKSPFLERENDKDVFSGSLDSSSSSGDENGSSVSMKEAGNSYGENERRIGGHAFQALVSFLELCMTTLPGRKTRYDIFRLLVFMHTKEDINEIGNNPFDQREEDDVVKSETTLNNKDHQDEYIKGFDLYFFRNRKRKQLSTSITINEWLKFMKTFTIDDIGPFHQMDANRSYTDEHRPVLFLHCQTLTCALWLTIHILSESAYAQLENHLLTNEDAFYFYKERNNKRNKPIDGKRSNITSIRDDANDDDILSMYIYYLYKDTQRYALSQNQSCLSSKKIHSSLLFPFYSANKMNPAIEPVLKVMLEDLDTIVGRRYHSAGDISETFKDIIKYFFICSECRSHFLRAYDNCVASRCLITSPEFDIEVNDRKGVTEAEGGEYLGVYSSDKNEESDDDSLIISNILRCDLHEQIEQNHGIQEMMMEFDRKYYQNNNHVWIKQKNDHTKIQNIRNELNNLNRLRLWLWRFHNIVTSRVAVERTSAFLKHFVNEGIELASKNRTREIKKARRRPENRYDNTHEHADILGEDLRIFDDKYHVTANLEEYFDPYSGYHMFQDTRWPSFENCFVCRTCENEIFIDRDNLMAYIGGHSISRQQVTTSERMYEKDTSSGYRFGRSHYFTYRDFMYIYANEYDPVVHELYFFKDNVDGLSHDETTSMLFDQSRSERFDPITNNQKKREKKALIEGDADLMYLYKRPPDEISHMHELRVFMTASSNEHSPIKNIDNDGVTELLATSTEKATNEYLQKQQRITNPNTTYIQNDEGHVGKNRSTSGKKENKTIYHVCTNKKQLKITPSLVRRYEQIGSLESDIQNIDKLDDFNIYKIFNVLTKNYWNPSWFSDYYYVSEQ